MPGVDEKFPNYQPEREDLNLGNLCGGAIEEVFQRELAAVLANIADVNTRAEGKRKITLEFTFAPFEDRTGAQVTFSCNSKIIPVNPAKGTVFLMRKGVSMVAVPHDPKQIRLFDPAAPLSSDKQQ